MTNPRTRPQLRPPRTPFTPRDADDGEIPSTMFAPLPPDGVTLCELHAELLALAPDAAVDGDSDARHADEKTLNRFVAAGGVLYPHVQLPADLGRLPLPPPTLPPDPATVHALDNFPPNDFQQFAEPKENGSDRTIGALRPLPGSAAPVIEAKRSQTEGSVVGKAVQKGLDTLFSVLLALVGNRAASLASEVTDSVRARAAPIKAQLDEAEQKYIAASLASSAFKLVWNVTETLLDLVPPILPSQLAQQVSKKLFDRLRSLTNDSTYIKSNSGKVV